jgi:hypothetical protein
MIEIPIKCRVILSPSTKKGFDEGDICKRIKKSDVFPDEDLGYLSIARKTNLNENEHFVSCNINIISPEKFQIGDFVFDYTNYNVGRFNGTVTDGGNFSDHCWKIAATTSEAIRINSTFGTVGRIPPAFIEEYVASNGTITDIETQACVTGKAVYNDFKTNEIIILRETKSMNGYDLEDGNKLPKITDDVQTAARQYIHEMKGMIPMDSEDATEEGFMGGVDWAFKLIAQQAAEKPAKFGGTDVLEVARQRYGGGQEAIKRRLDFINGSTWQQEKYLKATENALIPLESYRHDVFAIKDGKYGKEAFIGYFLPNGNFHFVSVPYTEK